MFCAAKIPSRGLSSVAPFVNSNQATSGSHQPPVMSSYWKSGMAGEQKKLLPLMADSDKKNTRCAACMFFDTDVSKCDHSRVVQCTIRGGGFQFVFNIDVLSNNVIILENRMAANKKLL